MFSLIEALSSHGVWLGEAGWGWKTFNHHNHNHHYHIHNHQKHHEVHHCHLSRANLEYWSPASTSLSPSSWCNSCQWDVSCRNITPQSKGFHHHYHDQKVITIITKNKEFSPLLPHSKDYHYYYHDQRIIYTWRNSRKRADSKDVLPLLLPPVVWLIIFFEDY